MSTASALVNSRSNGRPEAEVIVNYADGLAYSKHKMEEAFQADGFLGKPWSKPPAVKSSLAAVKKEDIDVVVQEFEIPRAQAEKVLAENGGDLRKALASLVAPPSKAQNGS
ncbi:hypothetical protein CPB83DRAFT_846499 [Crepidotus variabilis]|uniref:Nascent polypeptide-associated complex subunit alpha-like UBA domain-containing protein n=1 Tax=Crepidotus variabilis TaxID=179855 RepID=A0A9P6JUH3_9AGAR|nr:hypothetical protein CPB83DRAFT_846499 [Crepidotus variabilis]